MNILVVDDARDMRLIIEHYLLKLNHTVDIAVDGEDAWEKLLHNDYQVVISDWVMPKVNGLQLCQKIRNHSFNRYIYFILLTGMSGKLNLMSGIKAGADDFVNKPVDEDELDVRLRSAKRVLELEHSLEAKNIALEKAHNHIKQDLINAEVTQMGMLPDPIDNEHLTSSWYFKPAIFVGGDTFNYYSPSPDFLVFFSIDISGHGISSAMLSMSLQSTLALKRSLYGGRITRENIENLPSVFANNLNEMIIESDSAHYLTMIFGIIDYKKKDIHFVQAGHPHPLWHDHSQDTIKPIDQNGFPIGLIEKAEYETQHLSYGSGDKFIIYSDGISEIKSSLSGEQLVSENLYKHFDDIKSLTSTEMIEVISEKWTTKDQLEQLPDDLSILIFEFK